MMPFEHATRAAVIARSEATKQSIVQHALKHELLRFARTDAEVTGCISNARRNPV
jgi:hypothetical protein